MPGPAQARGRDGRRDKWAFGPPGRDLFDFYSLFLFIFNRCFHGRKEFCPETTGLQVKAARVCGRCN